MRSWIAVLISWLFLATSALAENRLALVIGNDGYKHIAVLQKARADAKSYAGLLREKGYSVQEGYDLGFLDMQAAVAQFIERIQPGDTAVFVYSGHGWSDGSTNYVVGVDVPDVAGQELLARVSLPIRNGLTGVLDDFARKAAGLKVAIIDACRDNPFHPPPNQRGYGLSRGLKPQSVEGSFVIYSAGEGQTALDGLSGADADPNSVFARTLLPLLRVDLRLTEAIKLSQEKTHALAASADHNQTPAYYDEVLGNACLSRACKSTNSDPDEAVVEMMIDAATSADFLAPLIAKLPDGPLKERAKARAAALKATQMANLTPRPPKPGPTGSSGTRRYILPAGAELVPQFGHSTGVRSLAFSPDGARIASGDLEGAIKLWDAASGKLLRTLEGHSKEVTSLAFSPDGARIASGSLDHTVRLWNAASGQLLLTVDGHSESVTAVAFSPDGSRLASSSLDHSIKLWEAASGKLLRSLDGHSSGVNSVAFSPDGARIASGSRDDTIKLWDAASGRLLRTFQGLSNSVFAVAFSPDSSRIASTGKGENTILLWDAASGKLLRTFDGAPKPVIVHHVLAGRRPHRINGEGRQHHPALGRGDRQTAANLWRAFLLCILCSVLAGRLPHRLGKQRPHRQALGRRDRQTAAELRRSFHIGEFRRVLAGRSPHRIGKFGPYRQALGRGDRQTVANLRRAFQSREIRRVLAGRRPHRIGEPRQHHQALGHIERPTPAHLRRTYGLCDLRRILAGWRQDRIGERR